MIKQTHREQKGEGGVKNFADGGKKPAGAFRVKKIP